MEGCEERTLAREAGESQLLKAIARKRRVKTARLKRFSECCGDI
jgi:hypothetical protein